MRVDAVGAGALALLDDAFDRGDGAGLIGDRTESREVGERGTDLTGAITEEQLPMVELGDERLDAPVQATDRVEPERRLAGRRDGVRLLEEDEPIERLA